MEDHASGNDGLLLARMRALARRGAILRQDRDGAGTILQADVNRAPDRVAPQEFLRMLDAGWLRADGDARFVISRRGTSALRAMLSRTGAEAAQRVARIGALRAAAADGSRPGETAGANSDAGRHEPRGSRRDPERPAVDLKESPLAWLAQRRDKDGKPMISASELEAGERLRSDFELAHLQPRVTSSWNPAALPTGRGRGGPGHGLELAEAAVAARQRVDAAVRAVGPEMSGLLLDVCCFLKGLEQAERNGGWPRRSGKVVLQLALAHLARHYGLDRRRDDLGSVQSWGAEGYRPTIDGDGPDAPGNDAAKSGAADAGADRIEAGE